MSATCCRDKVGLGERMLASGDRLVLTSGGLVAIMPVPEVLRVLDYRDARHANHHGVWPGIQGAWGYDTVVDMVKRAGRVFFAADHSHRSCGEEKMGKTKEASLGT